MSDDKNIMSDDEYQLPKDEYLSSGDGSLSEGGAVEGQSETVFASEKAGIFERFPFLKNKRFLVGVGVFAVIFVTYQCMRSPDHTVKLVAAKPKTVAPVVVNTPTPNPQLIGQLDSIKSHEINASQTVSALKNQLGDINDQLRASNAENMTLRNSVSQLAGEVKLLSHVVANNAHQLALAKQKKSTRKKPHYVAPKITYHVKAVVPGRAWIVGSNGLSYSVAVGDTLPQAGKIRAINADSGELTLSSGKHIGYGANDS